MARTIVDAGAAVNLRRADVCGSFREMTALSPMGKPQRPMKAAGSGIVDLGRWRPR
jgi:hypothetical protein